MIEVLIAEDHLALVDGILSFFKFHERISFVGHSNNGEDLLKLIKENPPDVVLADIRMPKLDGIEATKLIKANFQQIAVIAFSMFDQEEAVDQMFAAGASGYLLKNSPLSEMEKAIVDVFEGKFYYDIRLSPKNGDVKKKTSGLLTIRQIQILKLISQGRTNQEIAEILFIGKTTVETHRKNMARKLGLQGPGELLRYALQQRYDF